MSATMYTRGWRDQEEDGDERKDNHRGSFSGPAELLQLHLNVLSGPRSDVFLTEDELPLFVLIHCGLSGSVGPTSRCGSMCSRSEGINDLSWNLLLFGKYLYFDPDSLVTGMVPLMVTPGVTGR